MVRRAPVFLRAVRDGFGNTDVLDQIVDNPKDIEQVFVYQREGMAGAVHICGAKNLRGFYAVAKYRYLPDIDGQNLRDINSWQKWAIERQKQPDYSVSSNDVT